MMKVLRVLISKIGTTDLLLSEKDARKLFDGWSRSPKSSLDGITEDGVEFFFHGADISGLVLLNYSPAPQQPQGIPRPGPGTSGVHRN
jgi:hypothetical protein